MASQSALHALRQANVVEMNWVPLQAHPKIGEANMTLLANRLLRQLPPLHSTRNEADPTAYVRLFSPWSVWSWYLTEFDGKGVARASSAGPAMSWVYLRLHELQSAKGPGDSPLIQCDPSFEPIPISTALKMHDIAGEWSWFLESNQPCVWYGHAGESSSNAKSIMEVAKGFLNGLLKRRFEERVTLSLNAKGVARLAEMADLFDAGQRAGRTRIYVAAEISGRHSRQVFEPGEVWITSRVLKIYSLDAISDYFTAHVTRDWGELSEMADANEVALIEGGPIITGYIDVAGRDCDIFTNADRSQTFIYTND